MGARWAVLFSGLFVACVIPRADGVAGSYGAPSGGWLERGTSLAPSGPGYVLARPGDPARWGTPTLVGALSRAAASVEERFPGGAPLRVGDLSDPRGGRHPRHGSHRSGRDADVMFYATDAAGRSVMGNGSFAYDRYGVGRMLGAADGGGHAPSGPRFFDTARNWHFVRTLLAHDAELVQWIFCSRGLKARLLRYGALHEPDARVLARAAHVLHQPSNARAHRDHFHVRVLCTVAERSLGCRDDAPLWPWLRTRIEKPDPVEPERADDATLVEWLLSG